MNKPSKSPFECVDPAVGEQVWQLQLPDLEPERRAALQAHLSACHACNLLVQLDARAQVLGRAGRLGGGAPPGAGSVRRGPRPSRNRARWAAWLPFAACVAAVFILPPRPAAPELSVRGPDDVRFLRPVEGEVLATRRPALSWTPVAGATRYLVEVRDRDGRRVWAGESAAPAIRIPEDAALAPGREYRALLSARPADLVAPGQASVLFRTGTLADMVLHRLRRARPPLQVAALLALAFAALPWLRRRTARAAHAG